MTMPNDWQETSLGTIAERILSGGTPSTKNVALWEGTVPWITSKWLNGSLHLSTGEKFISAEAIRTSATSVVPSGNIIFATRVGVGKVAINAIEMAINQDLAGIVIPANKYHIPFIAYQLHSDRIQREVESHKRGATIKGITRENLKDLTLYCPPLPEQRKIAAVLGLVQRAIEQQERLLALTGELKKSLLHQLFTRGLRGEPLKETEIGPVPESWAMVRLGDAFKTQLGKMLSQKAHIGGDPKPYLRNKNVQWGSIGMDDLLEMNFSERERIKFRLVPGDLLICEGGEPGRAAIWLGQMDECYYQKALHRLRPKDVTITNEFLSHWLSFAFRLQNLYGVSGASSTIAHLPEVQLLALVLPKPCREDQDAICAALGAVDRRIQMLQRKRATLTDLFRTLLHQLMTAQIRVHDLDLSGLAIE